MRWISFFLLLFSIPGFAFTSHYNKQYDKAEDAWGLAHQLIEQSNAIDPSDLATRLHLLNQAVESLKRALIDCDKLLEKIQHKEKKEKKSFFRALHNNHPHWRDKLKDRAKELRTACRQKIQYFRAVQQECISIMQSESTTKTLFEEWVQNREAALETHEKAETSEEASEQLNVFSEQAGAPPQIQISTVEIEHKSTQDNTDPFYTYAIDLILPDPFPLQMRCNPTSQNPLLEQLGYGWKLELNPFLQDDKQLVVETGGTLVAYRFNPNTQNWEIFPEDSPDLYNFNQKVCSWFGCIKEEILSEADGSKSVFENGSLKTWSNSAGTTLTFSYIDDKVSQIETDSGLYCGFHYNSEGRLCEIYAKDGSRVNYTYNFQGGLIKVEFPHYGWMCDAQGCNPRILSETRPEGCILENVYDPERSDGSLGEETLFR